MNFISFVIGFLIWYFSIINAEHVITPTNNTASFCLKESSTVNFKVYVKNPDQIDVSSQGLDLEINGVRVLIDIDREIDGKTRATFGKNFSLVYLNDAGYFDFGISDTSGITMGGKKLNIFPKSQDAKYNIHVNGVSVVSEFKIVSDDEVACVHSTFHLSKMFKILSAIMTVIVAVGLIFICFYKKIVGCYNKCKKDRKGKVKQEEETQPENSTIAPEVITAAPHIQQDLKKQTNEKPKSEVGKINEEVNIVSEIKKNANDDVKIVQKEKDLPANKSKEQISSLTLTAKTPVKSVITVDSKEEKTKSCLSKVTSFVKNRLNSKKERQPDAEYDPTPYDNPTIISNVSTFSTVGDYDGAKDMGRIEDKAKADRSQLIKDLEDLPTVPEEEEKEVKREQKRNVKIKMSKNKVFTFK